MSCHGCIDWPFTLMVKKSLPIKQKLNGFFLPGVCCRLTCRALKVALEKSLGLSDCRRRKSIGTKYDVPCECAAMQFNWNAKGYIVPFINVMYMADLSQIYCENTCSTNFIHLWASDSLGAKKRKIGPTHAHTAPAIKVSPVEFIERWCSQHIHVSRQNFMHTHKSSPTGKTWPAIQHDASILHARVVLLFCATRKHIRQTIYARQWNKNSFASYFTGARACMCAAHLLRK